MLWTPKPAPGDLFIRSDRPDEVLVALNRYRYHASIWESIRFYWQGEDMHWVCDYKNISTLGELHFKGNLRDFAPRMPIR